MSQKWNYNNMEFEVDLQDADFGERYEAAFERACTATGHESIRKAGAGAGRRVKETEEVIRLHCVLLF